MTDFKAAEPIEAMVSEMIEAGADPDSPPPEDWGGGWAELWPQAVELQRELQAAIGRGAN